MYNLNWLTPSIAAWGVAAIILLALASFVSIRVRFWLAEGKKLKDTPGYQTPHVTLVARIIKQVVTRIFIYLKIGRYIVIGKQNRKFAGRIVAMANHQIEHDAVVVPNAMGLRPMRGWMAVNQIVGVRSPLAAWQGVIAVHHDRNPMAAVKATIKILKTEDETSFLVFPQGKLIRDNKMEREQFFAGAMMIAQKGAEGSKLPFAVLPVGVYYDRDPRHATLLHRSLNFAGYKSFRTWFGEVTYGVTVAIGEPILISSLPEDRDEAMEIVYQAIVKLSAEAEAETKRRLG